MLMTALINDGVNMKYVYFQSPFRNDRNTVCVGKIKNVMARSDIMHIHIIAFNNNF